MMYHNTIFGYKRFSSSEDSICTIFKHTCSKVDSNISISILLQGVCVGVGGGGGKRYNQLIND